MTEKDNVKSQMLISYTPGEECRVAVVEDGKLEEFHAERSSNISRVGNIYIGTVTNVEPSIQAAFVDFGVDHHGFLHVSDVHPRYFPGEDEDSTTERVGKKTPRRDRPPIQRCFKRGDQIEVQVLKEGVGTKGPTLTSYLSIPGRFLVMMPQMDRVGVSRKVEDEDQRREMRAILDQLELPEGFGFIVRTAGMDRTKLELKRDLAYLMRLWKDMESRRGTGNKPRLLYSESDLLVRALRDMVGPEIDEIVIDNELALARAARFLKIVSPRAKTRLLQYSSQTPLFHAYGIERQLALMHAREVPLPGGGRLVIDETEALVAIDVNSGKMRDARDAETNAYRTNCEAVEEICRQLKLRDLGGIVINDLIDMRHASHRKDIEQRFRDRMKRDRARSTLLPISDFGILEMTRQRMRGSHESVHFVDCPTCRGRGMVQKPDSIASDAMRDLAALVDLGHVARVEMVVSPRVASELLSSKRKALNKIERATGKHVDVRVSETVPIDRVSFYAYDEAGQDIDLEKIPKAKPPAELKVWELVKDNEDESWAADVKEEQAAPEPDLTAEEQAEVASMPAHPIEFDVEGEPEFPDAAGQAGEGGERRGRRRRRRRGRGGQGSQGGPAAPGQSPQQPHQAQPPHAPAPPPAMAGQPPTDPSVNGQPSGHAAGQPGEQGGRRRRRRRRRGRGGSGVGPDGLPIQQGGPQDGSADAPPAPAPLLDDETPRGDSWDLPASAVRPLPSTVLPAPAAQPPRHAPPPPVHLAPDDAVEDVAEGEVPPSGTEPPQDGTGEGGGRRRRRRRRRGRGGQGQPDGSAGPGAPVQPAPMNTAPPRSAPPPQSAPPPPRAPAPPRPAEPRIGGGYQKRQPEAPTPEVKPPARAPEVVTPPPKRFLYSTRRKLPPGEAAKRPRE